MPIYKGSTNQGLIYYGTPNTNCITSVPKNVNLTYNAGVFTVHAGSIITVPYGGGTTLNVGDKIGTVLEVVKVVDSYIQLKLLKDFSDTFGGGTSVLYMLTLGFTTTGGMYWSGTAVSHNTSGSTDSSASISDGSLYFNTTNNIIYRRYGGGTTGYQFGGGINGVWISLPIACHYGTPTKAEQIFDWCGFIGSTAFVLPGVKGLIPNGFNADGTYKSVEFTTDKVLTTTRTWDITASFIQKLFIYNRGKALGIQNYQIESNSMPTVNDWTVWYNPKENIQRWNNSSNTLTDISQWTVDTTMRYIGEIPSDGTSRITSLVPTTVQPLSTGIQISNVYKGSQLVYRFGFDPVTFTANSTWKVPPGIRQIRVDCAAAQGFTYDTATGGKGGRVQCILNVTPGQILYIKVGRQHTAWNDGTYDASDIRTVDADLNSRLVVAGAGGAGTAVRYLRTYTFAGGAGGGTTGAIGGNTAGSANNNATIGIGAGGGTQSAGGAGAYFSMYLKSMYASAGAFGSGGAPSSEKPGTYGASGYGGAGWYGGGGGVDGYYWASSSAYGASGAAAGGGSSYTNPTLCSNVVHTQGFRAGNGYVTISMV